MPLTWNEFGFNARFELFIVGVLWNNHKNLQNVQTLTPLSRCNSFGISGEHGCLANVVQSQKEHDHTFHTDTTASMRGAAVTERIDVGFDFLQI